MSVEGLGKMLLSCLAALLALGSSAGGQRPGAEGVEGRDESPSTPHLYASENITLPAEELLGSNDFQPLGKIPQGSPGTILAIFSLTSDACPLCLNEVSDYVQLLVARSSEKWRYQPLLLLFEAEAERAQHFVGSTRLELPTLFGTSRTMAEIFGRAQSVEAPVLQQLVFLDVDRSQIFFRVFLPNTSSPVSFKEKVLDELEAAHASLPQGEEV